MRKLIILAAGEGTRLRPYTLDRPKCLVEIQGRSILAWQMGLARKAGIAEGTSLRDRGRGSVLQCVVDECVPEFYAADECVRKFHIRPQKQREEYRCNGLLHEQSNESVQSKYHI